MVKGLKHRPYQERLKVLKTVSIKDRIKRGDLIETYKIMSGKLNVRREKFFKLRTTNTRGHHMKLHKEQSVHQARQRFFSQRVANDWNKLPDDVVSADTTATFKAKLDKHLQLKANCDL